MSTSSAAALANALRSQFGGALLTRVDEGYDAARRIWNGMIDRRPELIARCRTAEDVRASVRLARSEGLPVSIKGGGHSVAGTAVCDGGLMIDLSLMKGVRVDPAKREAVAAPGVLWGEFDAATTAHGLATPGGQVSHTGIAGLTLGGGLGYLGGKHGATCDNVLSLDVVTAEGELLTVSEEQNADLFWAMRGAGANFGIVTSFRYRVHPLGDVLAGMLLFPRQQAQEVLAFVREFLLGTPDELYTTVAFLNSPDGMPVVGVIPVWSGDIAEGERVLAPLRKFGSPVADLIGPMPYTVAQSMVDQALPVGNRYYWKSNFLSETSQGLATVLEDGANAMASPLSMALLFEVKGQIGRVPKNAMAFDHRDVAFEMSIIANWTDPAHDEANVSWTRSLWNAAQPYVSSAVYANHMTADESADRVRAAYGVEKYRQLAAVKRKYDPENFFRMNHNIVPAPIGTA